MPGRPSCVTTCSVDMCWTSFNTSSFGSASCWTPIYVSLRPLSSLCLACIDIGVSSRSTIDTFMMLHDHLSVTAALASNPGQIVMPKNNVPARYRQIYYRNMYCYFCHIAKALGLKGPILVIPTHLGHLPPCLSLWGQAQTTQLSCSAVQGARTGRRDLVHNNISECFSLYARILYNGFC